MLPGFCATTLSRMAQMVRTTSIFLRLVMTADICRSRRLAFGRHFVQRTGMILDIQPVTDLLPAAIYRQGLPARGVEDSQRDQFLREVIRTIVVGAVGHHHRQAVGAVPGANQMVAARFGGRVRAARAYGVSSVNRSSVPCRSPYTSSAEMWWKRKACFCASPSPDQ